MFEIKNNYVRGNCLEIMDLLPNNCIDVLITDPPNLILNKHYSTRKWFRRSFGDLGIVEHFFKQFFRKLERLLKLTSFLYIFCNSDSYPFFWYYLYPYTKKIMDLIWNKKVSINGYGWRHQHETVLYAEMPHAPPIKTGDGDIIPCRSVKVDDREHPAEKPEGLIEKFILKSSQEGQLIVDFFAGNGTVLKVAKRLNRNYFGCEYDQAYYKKGLKELQNNIKYNLEVFL